MYYKSTRYESFSSGDSNRVWNMLISHIQPRSLILEIGCYKGEMSRILKEKLGCSVIGVEINEKAATEARKYLDKLIVEDVEKADFPKCLNGTMFDVIIFSEVLEHLQDPETVVKKMRGILKNEGFVLASFPNIAYAGIIFDLLQGEFNYGKAGLLDRSHLRFFTKNEIHYFFERAGFYISQLDRVIIPYPQQSEFHTDLGRYSPEIVKEILKNKENLTYQFVVRAEKASEGNLIKYLKVRNRLLKKRLREAVSLRMQVPETEINQKLLEKDKVIDERNQAIQAGEKIIGELELKIQERDNLIFRKDKEFIEREGTFLEAEKKIYELAVRLQEKEELISQRDWDWNAGNEIIQEREKSIHAVREQLWEKDEMLERLRKELGARDDIIRDQEKSIIEMKDWLRDKDELIKQRDNNIYERDQVIEKFIEDTHVLGSKLEEKKGELSDRDQIIRDREEMIREGNAKIAEMEIELGARKRWQFWK